MAMKSSRSTGFGAPDKKSPATWAGLIRGLQDLQIGEEILKREKV
jgi:hypothetical protein